MNTRTEKRQRTDGPEESPRSRDASSPRPGPIDGGKPRLARAKPDTATGLGKEESPLAKTGLDNEDGSFVRQVRNALGLTRKDFARLTGFSERSIAEWEAGKGLSGPSRRTMREMQALQEALCAIAEPGEIGGWLLRPNEAFAGLKPLEVAERGEVHRLWQMLFWLQAGVPG